jgi:hypothetical protein
MLLRRIPGNVGAQIFGDDPDRTRVVPFSKTGAVSEDTVAPSI